MGFRLSQKVCLRIRCPSQVMSRQVCQSLGSRTSDRGEFWMSTSALSRSVARSSSEGEWCKKARRGTEKSSATSCGFSLGCNQRGISIGPTAAHAFLAQGTYLDERVNDKDDDGCDEELIGAQKRLQLAQFGRPASVYGQASLVVWDGDRSVSAAQTLAGMTAAYSPPPTPLSSASPPLLASSVKVKRGRRCTHRRCLEVRIIGLEPAAGNGSVSSMAAHCRRPLAENDIELAVAARKQAQQDSCSSIGRHGFRARLALWVCLVLRQVAKCLQRVVFQWPQLGWAGKRDVAQTAHRSSGPGEMVVVPGKQDCGGRWTPSAPHATSHGHDGHVGCRRRIPTRSFLSHHHGEQTKAAWRPAQSSSGGICDQRRPPERCCGGCSAGRQQEAPACHRPCP